MNQRDRILEQLRKGDWYSLADALGDNPPIYRLSERIRELEAQGHHIEHRRVQNKTYEEYRLIPTLTKAQEIVKNYPPRAEKTIVHSML